MINFTALSLYPRINSPRFPLDGRLGGPQSRSGRYEIKVLDPTGTLGVIRWGGMGVIDRDMLGTLTNLLVHKIFGNSGVAERLMSSKGAQLYGVS
jgi:hypothetical protein